MVGLGTLPVAAQSGSIARGISADGSFVVGDAFGYALFCFPQGGGGCVYFKSPTHAFRWASGAGIQDINGNASNSMAKGVSGDGIHAVGAAGALLELPDGQLVKVRKFGSGQCNSSCE